MVSGDVAPGLSLLAEARATILAGQQTDDVFVTARGHGMTRVMSSP